MCFPAKENFCKDSLFHHFPIHGWGNGEKDYLYKNSLWQESTRVPLIVRAPGFSVNGKKCEQPVSLVDLYPTLLDLCDLPSNTMKNDKGRPRTTFIIFHGIGG